MLLVRPKNMTRGLNRPQFIWKAAFHLSPFLYPYIVISPPDIPPGEILPLGLTYHVEYVRDQRQRVAILYSHHVELLVILDDAETPVLHLDEEYWRGHGQFRGAYVSAFEVLFKEVIQLLLFNQGQRVDFSAEHLSIGDKFNGVSPLLPIWELIKGLLSKYITELSAGLRNYVFEVC